MTKLSVSEIARRFNISRPTINKRLKSGVLSGERNENGYWQIDASEALRVFGEPKPVPGQGPSNTSDRYQADLIAALQSEISFLRERLEEEAVERRALQARLEPPRGFLAQLFSRTG